MNPLLVQDYTDDEEEEQPDVDMENSYYEAKGLKEANPRSAIAKFEHVSDLRLICFRREALMTCAGARARVAWREGRVGLQSVEADD